ncbi:MAG: biotin synthase BioB [Desulfobulbus propionicus]|nr:MAG: biotin synthase BioB [Desulfobulbus propionicus]
MNQELDQLAEKVIKGHPIDLVTARRLSEWEDREALFSAADMIRQQTMGSRFDLCSIINAKSGNCTENCRFCAQSGWHGTAIDTYRLIDQEEALTIARDNDMHGVHRLSLVTSGRNFTRETLNQLSSLYRRIADETSMQFCASCGLLGQDVAAEIRAVTGVSRYHCNLEANKGFFPKICTTHTWKEKVNTLTLARENGLSLCSGGIIGMGETMIDRIALALELREMEVRSIPINILTPIPGTPLAELNPLSTEEVLTTVALFRFINPHAVIRMAGGRQQLGADQYKCFTSGANGAIVGNYLTTTGSGIAEDKRQLRAMGFVFAPEKELCHD